MKTTQTELQKIADAIKGEESVVDTEKTTQMLLAEIRDNLANVEPSNEIKNTQVLLGEIAEVVGDVAEAEDKLAGLIERSLTDIKIPNGTTIIGSEAFDGCGSLASVEIPSSVTKIGANAFDSCPNLTTITIHKSEDSITDAPWGATEATVIWDG